LSLPNSEEFYNRKTETLIKLRMYNVRVFGRTGAPFSNSRNTLRTSVGPSYFLLQVAILEILNLYAYSYEIGEEYSTHERNANPCGISVGTPGGDSFLGRFILKFTYGSGQMVRTGLICLGTGTIGTLFECGNEP
jgi:hypothetical protein